MNQALAVLKIIHRTPRITPVMIHDRLSSPIGYNILEQILRYLRETGEAKRLVRGVYLITSKGVETLHSSEKTEADQ